MSDNTDAVASFSSLTGQPADKARFYLDAAGGDLDLAVSQFFDSDGNGDDAAHSAELAGTPSASQQQGQQQQSQQQQSGAYTLSGAPVEALPAGWGGAASTSGAAGGSSNSSRSATPSNPFRSNAGPRVTGFRDLAQASAPAPSGSRGGFGGVGGLGGDSDDEDEGEGGEGQTFFTGGAKSGLSVEDPNDPKNRKGKGGMSDMIKGILKQAREGSQRLAGAATEPAAGPSYFGGSANTLGSDETPSSYIPDPTKNDDDEEMDDDEEEMETVTRTLTFWKDGFSIEDGDLLKYEENKDLLAAIQSGRAPLSLLKVKFDQPVELIISERRSEAYVRQASAPRGPWGGEGQRLGDTVSPAASSSSAATATMPGALPTMASAARGSAGGYGAGSGASAGGDIQFEVDRERPTTVLQIRTLSGDRVPQTFNQHHTIADVRRFLDRAHPSSRPYVLATSFPVTQLTDERKTLNESGLLSSVVVQKPV